MFVDDLQGVKLYSCKLAKNFIKMKSLSIYVSTQEKFLHKINPVIKIRKEMVCTWIKSSPFKNYKYITDTETRKSKFCQEPN
jgi:hypothetical protein